MYEIKKFDNLLGINGLSDETIANHLKLYEGYVKNTNKMSDDINEQVKEGKFEICFSEMHRRFGWEYNGMRLHELYFLNITGKDKEAKENHEIIKKIKLDFDDYETWKNEFTAVGTMRGIGWVVLYYDPENNKLFNTWINEHDMGHLTTCVPLLVMDVFEHAYMLDYEINKKSYIDNFVNIIDWKIVNERFKNILK